MGMTLFSVHVSKSPGLHPQKAVLARLAVGSCCFGHPGRCPAWDDDCPLFWRVLFHVWLIVAARVKSLHRRHSLTSADLAHCWVCWCALLNHTFSFSGCVHSARKPTS